MPKQGWPTVPSPAGSPERAARADMSARRRLVISPRSASLLKAEARKKAQKLAPSALNQFVAPVPVAQQSQFEPRAGPSPNGLLSFSL